MNVEDRLRADLQQVHVPASLVPPPGLADVVLSASARERRARIAVGAGVTTMVAAAALPLVVIGLPGPGSGPGVGAVVSCSSPVNGGLPVVVVTTPPEPVFPKPGGGPRVADVYTVGEDTYLLDQRAGQYQRFPWRIVVSPDGRSVAVVDNQGRLGVAQRDGLTDRGSSAVTWIDVPTGDSPLWSPDGTALLFTSNTKSGDKIEYKAHRIELATRAVTDTSMPAGTIGGQAGWAADSRRYVVLLAAATADNTFVPGSLQYVEPDGRLGPKVDISGGLVGGAEAYSPSRRYLLVDTTSLMADKPTCSKVLDANSGDVVAVLAPGERPVGWYDDNTYVRLDPYRTKLELVNVTGGSVIREIPLGGAAPASWVQLGPSGQLGPLATGFGF